MSILRLRGDRLHYDLSQRQVIFFLLRPNKLKLILNEIVLPFYVCAYTLYYNIFFNESLFLHYYIFFTYQSTLILSQKRNVDKWDVLPIQKGSPFYSSFFNEIIAASYKKIKFDLKLQSLLLNGFINFRSSHLYFETDDPFHNPKIVPFFIDLSRRRCVTNILYYLQVVGGNIWETTLFLKNYYF